MKNREKFREAIVKAFENDDIVNEKTCRFVRDNVIPKFISEENRGQCRCGMLSCAVCSKIFAFWLDEEYDEEYEEPQKHTVDWYRVPIDTLVRVRNSEDEEWTLQYFKNISNIIPTHRFETWDDGRTSKTTDGLIKHWKYCELVEDKDDCE